MDYTYRDLSVEANRRLFVTADLKPADGQASLNPILYLPLNDPTAPGANAGTGGDFTLTGTVARSGRGPNQYNAPYSTFDGSADHLIKTSGLTVPSTKVFTLQMSVMPTTPDSSSDDIVYIQDSGVSQGINLRYFTYGGTSNGFYLELKNSTGYIFEGYVAPVSSTYSNQNRNYILTLAIDMDNQSNCRAYLNGVAATMSISRFTTGQSLPVLSKASIGVSTNFSGSFYNRYSGKLGALWFNPTYVDLSVADNLAKFVTGTGIDAKPVDLGANGELPTGTSPLIYLPMYGNNAGKNYGTGGDFTVNSGPYTGARGPNEFWGNKADFDGSTGYLSKTSALSGVSDSKTFSCSFWLNRDAGDGFIYRMATSGGDYIFFIRENGGTIDIRATSANGGIVVFSVNPSFTLTAGVNYCIQLGVDLSDTAKWSLYINGVLATTTYSVYVNTAAGFSTAPNSKFSDNSNYYDGKISEFYFTTDYIDFSQEANRLKFRDVFGNPVDLTQQIEDGAIPNPAIYMRFPPTSFGTNYGTGGNFTVNGTITDGGNL
jgi:hypothetical protein